MPVSGSQSVNNDLSEGLYEDVPGSADGVGIQVFVESVAPDGPAMALTEEVTFRMTASGPQSVNNNLSEGIYEDVLGSADGVGVQVFVESVAPDGPAMALTEEVTFRMPASGSQSVNNDLSEGLYEDVPGSADDVGVQVFDDFCKDLDTVFASKLFSIFKR